MTEPYDTLRMTRDEWLGFRRSHVGGSDVAAIMGLSPWRTAYQVWAEKAGLAEPEDISDRPRVEWGTRLEGEVAHKFSETHRDLPSVTLPDGPEVVTVMVSRSRPWAMATLDGFTTGGDGSNGVLEIKTAHYPTSKLWGESGTGAGGVPAHYLAQVNHYLSVTGWDRADVAVLIDGWDYREYAFDCDPTDVAAVTGAVDRFWEDNVRAGVPPEVVGADAGALRAVHAEPGGDYVDGDALALQMVEEWREAKGRARTAKSDADALEARLKAMIGDSRGLAFPEGRLTWTRSESLRFDSAALREADPETYELYRVPTSTQRMTWRDA